MYVCVFVVKRNLAVSFGGRGGRRHVEHADARTKPFHATFLSGIIENLNYDNKYGEKN